VNQDCRSLYSFKPVHALVGRIPFLVRSRRGPTPTPPEFGYPEVNGRRQSLIRQRPMATEHLVISRRAIDLWKDYPDPEAWRGRMRGGE
jgi:hypothetical protein